MDIFLSAQPTVCLLAETLAGPLADALNDICSLQTRQPDTLAPDALAQGTLPDLILIDGDLPGDQSDRLCLALKHHPSTQRIPVIWLSKRSSTQDQIRGFACGAADYIASTVPPELLRARVQAQLVRHGGSDVLSDINQLLEQTVLRSTQELATVQHVTLAALTALAETRDNETGNHIQRTQHYVRALALRLQHHPRFASFLTASTIEMLFRSAPLHDIGKVGIPDRILLKPGRFEPEEMAIMKTHTTLGRDVIEQAERLIGAKVGFLTIAKEIAYSHQEKWDGSGYPEGLAGEAIPVSARLMALADVYDAIISRRVYKEGMSHASAVHIISQGRGQHFDPDIVDAFLAILDEFQDIAARYADSDADLQKKQDYLEIATFNQRTNT
ncbi:MAG: HD domain-containing protein [Burkholderiales bacterium]|nr:HD domain-containing protein [Burkholderiales bacterium]